MKWEVLDQLMTNEADTAMNTDDRVIVAVAAIKADVLRFGPSDRELYATLMRPTVGREGADLPPGRFGGPFHLERRNWDQNAFRRIGGANLNKRSAGFVATQGLSQK
jgi:hypothetical protein